MSRKSKPTFEEALNDFEALSADDKARLESLKKIRARRRAAGLRTRRRDMQEESGIGNDDVVLLLRLLEALDGAAGAGSRAFPDPQVPPAVAAMAAEAKANADNFEQVMGETYRNALKDECEKVSRSFEAEIEDFRNTISRLRDDLEDIEDSEASLAKDLKTKNGIIERQSAELMHALGEVDRANVRLVEVEGSSAAFANRAEGLEKEVAILKTENADVRHMAGVSDSMLTEVKQDRDLLKAQAEKIPALLIEAAVLKAERDARANEAGNVRMMLKDAREDHSVSMARLRQDHADTIAMAQQRISELENLLLMGARNFAAAD